MMPMILNDEAGSMLPMTLGLVVIGLGIVALVLELALLGGAYRDIATVADLAAEAGAAKLVGSDAYDSGLTLDSAAASAEARRVGEWWGTGDEQVTVDLDGDRVCVTIADSYVPRTPVFLAVSDLPIAATGCAEPMAG